MAHLTIASLDSILATQLVIAWAGEARCEPRRLGWWETDIVDPTSGGDLMTRLAPRTALWASLEAVLEAARRTDALMRSKLANSDQMRSPFFLGFDVDEQLVDRLAALKRAEKAPPTALPFPMGMSDGFSASKLEAALKKEKTDYEVVPGGRQLKGKRPDEPQQLIAKLSSALFPVAPQYPLPFFRLEH